MLKSKKKSKRMKTHFEEYPHELCNHRAVVTPNGREENTFRFHVERGLLQPRMSALELCTFILHHMGYILGGGLLSNHPNIEKEFRAMYMMLATKPRQELDALLPWIRVEWHTGPDDIIHMNLWDNRPQAAGPTYFT